MDVHIATVGTTKEPIIDGILYYPTRPDKVYLIYSKGSRQFAEEIKDTLLKSLPKLDISLGSEIDEYSLETIVEAIMLLIAKEQPNQIFLNITGGTKVMSSGALIAAYFAGANAYYIPASNGKPSERIRELPIPKFQLTDLLKEKDRRILNNLLKHECNGEKCNITLIANELNEAPKSLSYHMNQLEARGLIEKDRQSRIVIPKLTHMGKMLLLLEKNKGK